MKSPTTPITHPPKRSEDKVALIDSDVFAVRAAATSLKEGESNDECVDRFMGMVRIACDYLGARPILCLGTPRTFRHEIFTKYKANRGEKPNPEGIAAIRKAIPLNYETAQGDNCETDDVMAAMQGTLSVTTIIVTNDKDLDQIAGWHYDPFGKAWPYPVSEQQATDWLMMQWLMGDSVDNIPGLDGVGPVGAYKRVVNDNYTVADIEALLRDEGLDPDMTLTLLQMDTDCKYTITDPLVAEAVQEYGDVEAVPF